MLDWPGTDSGQGGAWRDYPFPAACRHRQASATKKATTDTPNHSAGSQTWKAMKLFSIVVSFGALGLGRRGGAGCGTGHSNIAVDEGPERQKTFA